ncbi:hypothetical protein SMACR_07085 [Sordaria macrospora]|uniref:WGS project CABT00000000 data, contig 2.39 n=2 Tax=Sordaria macrospora TaxID=5147 RepID=F7W7H7_SORMK|nr:uncharacterized protein SMAC_07085 [Sordaria macrospora k-hell]KAA8630129.1 hypothetical protein SMACR_07085 [Sordaria macrospora]KAH7632155.1 hypothetical protein B0T09DRAFT_116118 [Sordaria sp. MPI-SDFR-AT-0083]WPJ63435.1 hypothetical protein SMAC4_07085 [Sordaria macrospora]CCC13461.1 unnamed protein product [Sordaria macrospora k-hell]
MPPINLYTHSPINAAKASDAQDPKTATPEGQSQSGIVPNANPDPHPTGTVTPNQATPTYLTSDRIPPPPQPGAVPTLPVQTGTATTTQGQDVKYPHLPPQPSSQYYPGSPAAPAPSGPITSTPHQMSIPPPTASYDYSQRGTSTTTVPPPPTRTLPTYLPGASPAELGLGPQHGSGSGGGGGDLSHPPGYQQDSMASDMNQSQRAAHEFAASHGGHGHGHGGGYSGSGSDDEGVWNSAKKWIQDAGAKVAEAESEVWKKINGQK